MFLCKLHAAYMQMSAIWCNCMLHCTPEASAMFPDFEHMFIDQYVPLDDNNIAQDKLQELW